MTSKGSRRARPRALTRIAVLGTLIAVGVCGCAGGARQPTERRPASEQGAARLVAVGDSITAADSVDFAVGELGAESWVSYALGEQIEFGGGWAQWGATTGEMAAAVPALDGDVLVVLAGTNDLGTGVPTEETTGNITEIVARAGVADVVLSAVPPIDHIAPEAVVELNAALAGLAERQGWGWVPPPADLEQDGRFAPGMASDGLHPTAEGARIIGGAVASAVLQERS